MITVRDMNCNLYLHNIMQDVRMILDFGRVVKLKCSS